MKLNFSRVAGLAAVAVAAALSGCDKKDDASSSTKLNVGYAQIGAESNWRTANSKSIKDEAAKRGINLQFSDGQQKQENQIRALRSFIDQKVDVIILSPVVETGWDAVLADAKKAGIPVVLSDRMVKVTDETLYRTAVGFDSVQEGRRAGEYLAEKTGGKAVIAQLEGTVGSGPANDRRKGFEEVIAKHPDMKILVSQSGNFERAKGKEVMEAILKSPQGSQITAVYAHNDDMALGAIQAIAEAGKKPGTDITIVSVDGVKAAFEAMVDGKLNATVECNPMIGAILFDTVESVKAGKEVGRRVIVPEKLFDQSTAKQELPNRQY